MNEWVTERERVWELDDKEREKERDDDDDERGKKIKLLLLSKSNRINRINCSLIIVNEIRWKVFFTLIKVNSFLLQLTNQLNKTDNQETFVSLTMIPSLIVIVGDDDKAN